MDKRKFSIGVNEIIEPGAIQDFQQENMQQLRQDGITVLKGIFDYETVKNARDIILNNRSLFKNTRPTPSALHLAGFHRFPELESLHTLLTCNSIILKFLKNVVNGRRIRSIGLSDITINRSQPWHKDLLRGHYRTYLDSESLDWHQSSGSVFKLLFYLQDSASLKVVPGSHLFSTPLDDDTYSEPDENTSVLSIGVECGDIAIMDIRCSHCGSPESTYATGQWDNNPRILISTAMGDVSSRLTQAMEVGNFHRLMDWMARNP
ncbi:phytanoyl-CoA dioxygenase family protein [Methylohalomonas lacus]|nr:hypothetical protein [Methylohalomonas lacus]